MIQYLSKDEKIFFALASQPILDFRMLNLIGKRLNGDFIENTSKRLKGTLNQVKLNSRLKSIYKFARPGYPKFAAKEIAAEVEELYGFTFTKLPSVCPNAFFDIRKYEISSLYSHRSSKSENGVRNIGIEITEYEITFIPYCDDWNTYTINTVDYDNNLLSFEDTMSKIDEYIFSLFPIRRIAIHRDRQIDSILNDPS